MDAGQLAKKNEILRVPNGSRLYGTNTENSDTDEIGVCIVPPQIMIGFQNFEQYEYRTSDDTIRNGPDDYDLTIYSAKKFTKLVVDGNPSLVNLLWVPEDMRSYWTPWADELMSVREHIHSRVAVGKFLGYMNSQVQRLKGEKKKHVPKRPEIVEQHGYDTKFASHAIRLGYQGLEFAQTGKITLPMPALERRFVVDIRNGRYSEKTVIEWAEMLTRALETYREDTEIPKRPNRKEVEEIIVELHIDYWYNQNLL